MQVGEPKKSGEEVSNANASGGRHSSGEKRRTETGGAGREHKPNENENADRELGGRRKRRKRIEVVESSVCAQGPRRKWKEYKRKRKEVVTIEREGSERRLGQDVEGLDNLSAGA